MTLAGQPSGRGQSGSQPKEVEDDQRMTHEQEQEDDALLRYLNGVSYQLFRLLDLDGAQEKLPHKSDRKDKRPLKSVDDDSGSAKQTSVGRRGRKPRQNNSRKVAAKHQIGKRRQSRRKPEADRSEQKVEQQERAGYDRVEDEEAMQKLADNLHPFGRQHQSNPSQGEHESQLALNIGDELSNQLEAHMVADSMTPSRTHLSPMDSTLAQLSACNTPNGQQHLHTVTAYFGSQRLNGQADEFGANVGASGDELLDGLSSSTNRPAGGHTQLVLPLALVDDTSATLMHSLGESCYSSSHQLYAPASFHHHEADYHHQQNSQNQHQQHQHHHQHHQHQHQHHHHTQQLQIEPVGQHHWLGPMMSCQATICDAQNRSSSSTSSSANSLTTVTSAISSHGQMGQEPSVMLVNHASHEHQFAPMYQPQAGYYTAETHALTPSGDFSNANQSSHSQNLATPARERNAAAANQHGHQRAGPRQASSGNFESNQQQQIVPARQNYHEQAQAQHYGLEATRHHEHHYQQTFHQSQQHQHRELHNHLQQQAQQPPQVIHHAAQPQAQPHHHLNHHHHHHHHMMAGLEGGIEPSSVILQDINLASATWVSPEDLYSI